MAQLLMPRDLRSHVAQIRIVPDLEQLNRAAADEFVRLAQQQAQERDQFSVALAGGSTPRSFYALLASESYCSRVPWESVHLFWGDERCVPPDHPESNFHMAQETLLSRVPLPAVNIHPIPLDQGDPDSIAKVYEQNLRAFFQLKDEAWPEFDLVLLGLGEDGHTASLFPHSVALREESRLVIATTGGDPNLPRVTLTIPVLNHAKHLIWLVAGAKKASIVHKVLEDSGRSDAVPAQMLQPTKGSSIWFVDRAAASLLRTDETHPGETL